MSFRDLPEPEELLTNEAEVLESRLVDLEAQLAPYAGAAWLILKGQLEAELMATTNDLIGKAMSADQVWQMRGRCQALQWVIGLPDQIQAEIDFTLRDLEQVQEATQTTEGEQDAG